MTIFLEITKAHLKECIVELRNKSANADASTSNTLLNMFNMGRDPLLSKKKQNLADTLLQIIQTMEDCKDDLQTKTELEKLIKEYQGLAKHASDSKHYDEGRFGKSMNTLKNMLDLFYEKLEQANLLDIQHDQDPLNQFRFHMANYLLRKVFNSLAPKGFCQRVMENPKITSIVEVTLRKEQLVLNALQDCMDDLESLNIQYPDYLKARKKRVLEHVDRLNRQNNELCKQHSAGGSLPIKFTFFASVSVGTPTVGPGPAKLGDSLQDAWDEITANQVVAENTFNHLPA